MSRIRSASADALAREYTERAIETVAEIMTDGFAEDKDRLKAADIMLDRGHGKPSQAIIAVPSEEALKRQLAAMSDDDLMQVINDARLPRLTAERTIEGTAVEVDPGIDPLLR